MDHSVNIPFFLEQNFSDIFENLDVFLHTKIYS